MQCFNDEEMEEISSIRASKRVLYNLGSMCDKNTTYSRFISMMLEFVKRHYKQFVLENNKKGVKGVGGTSSQQNETKDNDNNK